MGWTLELVETGPVSASRRIEVARLGEIVAPAGVEEIGLDHATAKQVLAEVQRAVTALQEEALRTEAYQRCRLDPILRLKDYRLRRIQCLHGTLAIRVPRLARIGTGERAPTLLSGSARSTAEYQQLLARLGAWMSFRAAAGRVGELFPLASGGCPDTVRRRILDEADRIAARRPPSEAGAVAPAKSIDLGVDTTFVRSCSVDGPRHHEVLIGIGTADDGRTHRIGQRPDRPGRSVRQPRWSGSPRRPREVRSLASTASRVLLKPSERVVLDTPGAGGYGPPAERTEDAIREDLEPGKFSAPFMTRHYGDWGNSGT